MFFCRSVLTLGSKVFPEGKGYFQHIVRETVIPCTMVLIIRNINDRKQKRYYFNLMCDEIIRFVADFDFPMDRILKWVITSKNYLLGYLFLFLRYRPRHFLGRHPLLLAMYKKITLMFRF